jgi:hypothetical protein
MPWLESGHSIRDVTYSGTGMYRNGMQGVLAYNALLTMGKELLLTHLEDIHEECRHNLRFVRRCAQPGGISESLSGINCVK